ncbi:synaptonemal complex central element protein 1 isoform X2 [Pseudophryne corroboree]|uniref:synaptonemal complex central element protein 1 isoform X2 n=1 Tax=Pseudophryne corroboree TaxID=495146 RepID=UPI0030814B4B
MGTWNQRQKSETESLLKQVREMHGAGNVDPKMEDVLKKISMIQKAGEQTEAESKDLEQQKAAVQDEMEKVHAEKVRLREVLQKKQENIQILKLQRDNLLEKEKRLQEQTEETKKKIDDLATKIQQEKLKQRKQRMEFQDHLEDLMTKHKSLAEFYNSKRLAAEIPQMEERKKELLEEEREKVSKLKEVQETEDRLRAQGVLTAETLFLHSEEAACAVKLFQEENTRAKSMLETVTACHTDLLNKYNRLKAEVEAAERNPSTPGVASSSDPQQPGRAQMPDRGTFMP